MVARQSGPGFPSVEKQSVSSGCIMHVLRADLLKRLGLFVCLIAVAS